jgi:hypothetical protein
MEAWMRRLCLLVLAMHLAACNGAGDAPAGQNGTPSPHRTLRQDESGFALLRNGDTLAIERYTRSGNSLSGEIFDIEDNSRLTYTALVGADERITRIELAYFAERETAPQQRAVAEFRGDTLIAQSYEGDEAAETDRLVTPDGTMIHLGPSPALLEQLLRRARALGGDTASIPVLLVGRDEERHEVIERVTVRRMGRDSVHVVLDAQNQARVAVDGEGRIQGGSSAGDGVRVVRLR